MTKGGCKTPMNKAELIAAVAERTTFSKKEVSTILAETLDVITETVENGEKVVLIGFGTFGTAERKAKTGINPQTKKKMKIPAKVVPVFKAGSAFKEGVARKQKASK